MKNCVIFASHIPDKESISHGQEIFSYIHNYLGKDTDVYVGINPCQLIDDWIKIVEKHAKSYEVTSPHLTIKSDASAYQSGLRAYWKDKNSKYDNIWFLRTIGTRHESARKNQYRKCSLERLVKHKESALDRLNSEDYFGGYAAALGCYAEQGSTIGPIGHGIDVMTTSHTLDKYCELPCSPFYWITLGSMYIIKGNIIDSFLDMAGDKFLNEQLSTPNTAPRTAGASCTTGDPYFFERDFIQIVPRQGFITLYDSILDAYSKFDCSGNEFYLKQLKKWILENNLDLSILNNDFVKKGRFDSPCPFNS